MVKRSLAKINGSGSMIGSSGSLDAVGLAVNTLAGGITNISAQIAILSGALADANMRIVSLQSSQVMQPTMATNSGNTISPSTVSGVSAEDQSVLDMLLVTAE